MSASGCRLILLGFAACGATSDKPDLPMLATATDLDPGEAMEVEVVAEPLTVTWSDGSATEMWAYRDGAAAVATLPGPLIVAERGQRLTVHLLNRLDTANTTLHLHGARLPAPMDGSMATQTVVAPGEEFHHVLDVVDEGLAWYHPHVAAEEQVERGLYGPLLMRGGAEADVTADRVLMLDDLRLDGDGAVDAFTSEDRAHGRAGDLLLINGMLAGEGALRVVGRERWRLVNAANARTFRLGFADRRSMRVVAGDGGGIAEPFDATEVCIAPGERLEFLVEAEASTTFVDFGFDRGYGLDPGGETALFDLEVQGRPARVEPIPEAWEARPGLEIPDGAPTRRMVLESGTSADGDPLHTINGESWPFHTPLDTTVGTVEIWTVENRTEGDQPFHIHGTYFEVLDVDGVPPARRAWKDVAVVPAGATARLGVRKHAARHVPRCALFRLIIRGRGDHHGSTPAARGT